MRTQQKLFLLLLILLRAQMSHWICLQKSLWRSLWVHQQQSNLVNWRSAETTGINIRACILVFSFTWYFFLFIQVPCYKIVFFAFLYLRCYANKRRRCIYDKLHVYINNPMLKFRRFYGATWKPKMFFKWLKNNV